LKIKKIVEDAHRSIRISKMFLIKASNVLTKWVTWCGRTRI